MHSSQVGIRQRQSSQASGFVILYHNNNSTRYGQSESVPKSWTAERNPWKTQDGIARITLKIVAYGIDLVRPVQSGLGESRLSSLQDQLFLWSIQSVDQVLIYTCFSVSASYILRQTIALYDECDEACVCLSKLFQFIHETRWHVLSFKYDSCSMNHVFW